MKAKLLAGMHAATFSAVLLASGSLLYPMTGHSEAPSFSQTEKFQLLTTDQFVEMASIYEVQLPTQGRDQP